jgi:hypothetical protein
MNNALAIFVKKEWLVILSSRRSWLAGDKICVGLNDQAKRL